MLISWRVYIFFQNTGQQKGMRSLTKTLKKKKQSKTSIHQAGHISSSLKLMFFFWIGKTMGFLFGEVFKFRNPGEAELTLR